MKYLSLFSGIGGFELGIQQAYVAQLNGDKDGRSESDETNDDEERERLESETWKNIDATNRPLSEYNNRHSRGQESLTCVGFSEIDKYAVQIYQKHFPEHKNYGDITRISTEEIPGFDLLVGGFPCQSFSIAGKRGGFSDTRGTLFFEIARIIKAKHPKLFLLENVKGLLSHDEGRTFATIISALDELGYDLQWQVLNSKDFGVPQNRERIFIIGHLRGTSRPEVFPFGEVNEGTNGRKSSLSRKIQSENGEGDSGHSDIEILQDGENGHIHQLNNPTHSNDRVYGADGVSPTLNTAQGGRRQPFVLEPDMKIRRLTPTECERLQGFPDGWTEGVSDTQRYKTLGNAVTVNVIQAICEKLLTLNK